jgi:hypothetical protein
MMRKINYRALIVALVIAVLSGVVWVKYLNYHTNEARLKQDVLQKQELLTKKAVEIKKLNGSTVELQKQAEQLKKEKADLESQLQAKRAEANKVANAKIPVTQVAQAQGSCGDMIAAAGVSDVANAVELIRRESGCNPHATNSSSGACGIAQELPCGKSGCTLGDGVCQIRWMQDYVTRRYGSWAGAVAFHNSHNWY